MMYQEMALYKIISDREESILLRTEYFRFDQCPDRDCLPGHIWQPTLEVFFGSKKPERLPE